MMILPMRLLIGCVALLVAANAAGQVYRWTDEKGRVVYGNEPPPSAKAKVVQERINSYSGTPEVQRAPAVRAAPALPVVDAPGMHDDHGRVFRPQAIGHFNDAAGVVGKAPGADVEVRVLLINKSGGLEPGLLAHRLDEIGMVRQQGLGVANGSELILVGAGLVVGE